MPDSLSYVWGEFFTMLLAVIGGIVVLSGICLERKAEVDWFRNFNHYKKKYCYEKWGYRLVMVGIFIETIVGAKFAYDDYRDIQQIKANAAKNDPMNQPVTDVYAQMNLVILGNQFIEGPSKNSGLDIRGNLFNLGTNSGDSFPPSMNPGSIYGWFPVTNFGGGIGLIIDGKLFNVMSTNGFYTSSFGQMEADGFTQFGYPGQNIHGYHLNFHLMDTSLDEMSDFPGKTPILSEFLTNVNWLDIYCDFLPANSQVLRGSVRLTVNGHSTMNFQIFPKSNEAHATADGTGFSLTATNAVIYSSPFFPATQLHMSNGKIDTNNLKINATLQTFH